MDGRYQPGSISDYHKEPCEVYEKLTQINVYKSTDPYVIPNWLLKDMAPFIAEPICVIFNASVRQGHVPDLWKQANVAAV